MLQVHLLLGIVGVVLVGYASGEPVSSRAGVPTADLAIESCRSLQNSCNATAVDFDNFYSYIPCIMLTTCSTLEGKSPEGVLSDNCAPTNQPRLTEETFQSMSSGNSYMSRQNYIDAYYSAISQTPGGTYPNDVMDVVGEWEVIAAWTGFCDTQDIPYSNFADWLEYSSIPGVCGAVSSCTSTSTSQTCVPQPPADNGSCEEIVKQCRLWVDGGLFQNEFCVLASMCYAWSNTDVLLAKLYPSEVQPPTTLQQARLSEDVFYEMTGCSDTLTQQDVIDAYYRALENTWVSGRTSEGATPARSTNDGPYPMTPLYVVAFWQVILAWTGDCTTDQISYSNFADYLSYAAGSNYHPSC